MARISPSWPVSVHVVHRCMCFGNLIDGKIFTGTSINPVLTAFDSLQWSWKGYKLTLIFHT